MENFSIMSREVYFVPSLMVPKCVSLPILETMGGISDHAYVPQLPTDIRYYCELFKNLAKQVPLFVNHT